MMAIDRPDADKLDPDNPGLNVDSRSIASEERRGSGEATHKTDLRSSRAVVEGNYLDDVWRLLGSEASFFFGSLSFLFFGSVRYLTLLSTTSPSD